MSKPRRDTCPHETLPARLVISFVGGIGVLALSIFGVLSFIGKPVSGLESVVTGCVTGLIGLLGQTRASQRAADEPQEVEIVNEPENPVPTEEKSE